MGEKVQPCGFIIPSQEFQGRMSDVPIEDILFSQSAIHWPQGKYKDDNPAHFEIQFETKVTTEMEKFIKEQAEIFEEQRHKVEYMLDGMACAAVSQRFGEKSKEEQEYLREFANLVARYAWNACYGYHKAMIER